MQARFALLKPDLEHRRQAWPFGAIKPAVAFKPTPGLADVLCVHATLLRLRLNRWKGVASIAGVAARVIPEIGVNEHRAFPGLASRQQFRRDQGKTSSRDDWLLV